MDENQYLDKKSIRVVLSHSANWSELAKDCVCFANARGGTIHLGIEDGYDVPPPDQRIPEDLPSKILKRIAELTVNVGVTTNVEKAGNGGEYIQITVLPSTSTIASTTDGRYYLRVADHCQPVLPDDLTRLLTDKPSFIWETKLVRAVKRDDTDVTKLNRFLESIRSSERVSSFVKSKSPDELLDYYMLAEGEFLTNLGVLWVGKRNDRAKLLYAPVIQFLKYDLQGNRVNKLVWDDFSLNPAELIEAIWTQIPDWREGIEISDGLFRKFIPNYEEEVIRELLTNALVHRPYTTRGDIFINLYPDRLEVHNPGRFPIGVTPQNMLHTTVRRNEHLAKLFYDYKLMEREGSGYDKICEILLSNGKQLPIPAEGTDRVTITVRKRIAKPEIVSFINRINEQYQLRQKELICLGLIAQHTSLSSLEFSKALELPGQQAIKDWLGRLPELDIVKTSGRTKGTAYYVNPQMLRLISFKGKTNLKRIESHRLRELIYQDLSTYPQSAISEVCQRIGLEIPQRRVKLMLDKMIESGDVVSTGVKKWTRYAINAGIPGKEEK